MKEIIEGIYRLETSGFSNAHLVKNGADLLMVDTGVPGRARKILDEIRSDGFDPKTLRGIFLTHCHPDHIGNLHEIAEAAGAESFIHPGDIDIVRGLKEMYKYRGMAGLAISFVLDSVHRFSPHDSVKELRSGGVEGFHSEWEAIHTPGHTPGSTCLYSRERKILFAGDCLNRRRGRLAGPKTFFTHNLEHAWKSVEKIAGLDLQVVLFGHGPALTYEPAEQIKSLLGKAGKKLDKN